MAADLGKIAVTASECICRLHARSPVVEWVSARPAISVLLAGTFHSRGREGAALLAPGSILLKNAGAPHEYRHVDDGGDRSVVFEYAAEVLEGRRFARLAIAPTPATAAVVAQVQHAAVAGDPEELADAGLAVAAVALDAGRSAATAAATLEQVRRVARVVRHLDAHSEGDCTLGTLAALAGLSSFHFLRVFRAVTGETPRRYVIAARLRSAAAALRASRAPVTEIAYRVGFGDLSHFTTSFRRAFGVSPGRYRAAS